MSNGVSRRQFMKAAVVTAAVGPHTRAPGRPPSDRVRLGFIACGGRARYLMKVFKRFPDVDIPVICDVIEPRMDQATEILSADPGSQKPDRVVEYQRVLDRKDVDAVVIATTEHWHALPAVHAAQAGKSFFVEKPLSHSIAEGRLMVEAAEKYGVVAMMGTQQRGGLHFQKAVEIVQLGRLGKIGLVECWNYHNTKQRVGRAPDSDPPPGYHWDLWLGSAPKVPFNQSRLPYSWWFDYGGGMMTNWAVHHVDVILWAMRTSAPRSASCTGGKLVIDDLADTPDTIEASWEFPGFVMQYRYRGFNNFHPLQSRPNHHGIAFYGDAATLVLDRSGYEIWSDANPKERIEVVLAEDPYFPGTVNRGEQDGPWHRTFLDCVKAKRQPPIDLETSHKATVCCLLGNIAYLTRRRIIWDAGTEQITDDAEAAKLLDPARRKAFELPRL